MSDIETARDELHAHSVEVSMFHEVGGFLAGAEARAACPDPRRRSYASFSDPDGNVWLLQEITERLPGRV